MDRSTLTLSTGESMAVEVLPADDVPRKADGTPTKDGRASYGTADFHQLKKLSRKHKNMIALALQGNKREVVAEACGCTPEYVSMILRQPLAKGYIKELEEYLDIRMRGLLEKTVDAVDVGLSSKSVETRLKAAKLQLQVTGKLEPDEATKATAEDLVMNILNVGGTVTVRS